MDVRDGFVGSIGNTPLIRLRKASESTGCTILGKAEFLNPGGSVKDRAALYIILDAEKRGVLRPGGVIVEGTAGNTGIGLALVGNARGYRTVIVIPETQSSEKKEMLRLCGAELTDRPVRSLASVGHPRTPPVQVALGLGLSPRERDTRAVPAQLVELGVVEELDALPRARPPLAGHVQPVEGAVHRREPRDRPTAPGDDDLRPVLEEGHLRVAFRRPGPQLQDVLDRRLGLATEDEVSTLFKDCDVGAVPAIGISALLFGVAHASIYRLLPTFFEPEFRGTRYT